MNATDKTCRHGHPMTPENTYRRRDGQRLCRTCLRERQQRVYDMNYRAFSPQQHRVSGR